MPKRPDLPSPADNPSADVVIYDGQCNFCRNQVRHLSRLDLRADRLAFLSLHDQSVADRYPELSHDDMMERMYVVDGDGNPHGGSEAVKYLSRRLPVLWPVMPILHFPGTAGLWRWAYQQVAKRRYKLAGKTACDEDQCSLHL